MQSQTLNSGEVFIVYRSDTSKNESKQLYMPKQSLSFGIYR